MPIRGWEYAKLELSRRFLPPSPVATIFYYLLGTDSIFNVPNLPGVEVVELRCRTGRRFAPTKLARFAPEIFAEHLHPDNTTGKQDGASEETLSTPQSP